MSAASKALYKPLSIATSVAGGLLAGKVFTEIWQRARHHGVGAQLVHP
jgi:hypothetical protein